ncbi:MAG: ribokinase [Chloroflexi bacterium]|jgi:sugar/nucleoside kinase (ribokinase family)|nr:ribokinase [Chloroflexota bacterium]
MFYYERQIRVEPIDYLLIGHVTQDLTPQGPVLGGTVSYSGLTALALGQRVGVVTACSPAFDLSRLDKLQVVNYPSEHTTTFQNLAMADGGRTQYLHTPAARLDLSAVPELWRNAPIVHLAPVAGEVDPNLVRAFPNAQVYLTPQGWMRARDAQERVFFSEWPETTYVFRNANAAVLSIEDVEGDEAIIDDMLSSIRVLAVTEGADGARVYWNGDVRRFRPPTVVESDPTGAGDIFAAAFFSRLFTTRDPWEAGRFATQLAAYSVTRPGLSGAPTFEEIQLCAVEITQRPET